MNANPGLAMQVPAHSDTIPILNASFISRTPSVMRVIRGGCQTPKASINRLTAGGSPSFAPPRRHHPAGHPRPAAATQRLPSSHGITSACGSGTERNGTERNGTERNGTERSFVSNRSDNEQSLLLNILILANRVFGFLGYKYVGA
jgi:hypothetical protein